MWHADTSGRCPDPPPVRFRLGIGVRWCLGLGVVGCSDAAGPTPPLIQAVTVAVVNAFVGASTLPESSQVYVSQEFLGTETDLEEWTDLDRRYMYYGAQRSEVAAELVLTAGDLLLEPLAPNRAGQMIRQDLNFFFRNGPIGQVRYTILYWAGRMRVLEGRLVWIT